MVFNSRVVPVFMLWLPKISGLEYSIYTFSQVNTLLQEVTVKSPLLQVERLDGAVVATCSLYNCRKPVAHVS